MFCSHFLCLFSFHRAPKPLVCRHFLSSLWFTVYGLQLKVYGLQFTVYGLRFTVYCLRFTWYGLYGSFFLTVESGTVYPVPLFFVSLIRLSFNHANLLGGLQSGKPLFFLVLQFGDDRYKNFDREPFVFCFKDLRLIGRCLWFAH